MPNISRSEIDHRALLFSHDWQHATSEKSDKQTFWNEFFNIFDIPRRTVASFEEPVRRLRGTYSFIDLLWPGKVLIEHKSAGESLEAAQTQAFDYIHDLQAIGRGDEIPRYVLLSDFQRFALYDLEPDEQLDLPLFRNRRFTRTEFPLSELLSHTRLFDFIPGYQVSTPKPQAALNLRAVEIMTGVHDSLETGGYSGHQLERLLVRILFCLFADKTGIFEPESFRLYIEERTRVDGSDLGARLNELFATLDTEPARRQRHLDESLQVFPYVNGALFNERLDFPAFNSVMRKTLLNAINFKWASISPAIFGALFQEVLKPKERRSIGAHYTSEQDILKVIKPLFLDALQTEFATTLRDRSTRRASRLEDIRVRLTRLKLIDPACGCGNFLVVAYRELRALELAILREQHSTQQALTLGEVARLSQLDVDQFYGIEIQEWPARIAEVALWLVDHQSNMRIHEAFGQPFLRLPLRKRPNIHVGNALRMDWNDLLPASDCSYILGNPPFVGKSLMSAEQKQDVGIICHQAGGIPGGGVLDYVTAWYIKAAAYIDGTLIEVAFVSTNSIAQGEQPGILWNYLFSNFHLTINFAYQTFAWTSEARGKAHVHVVIVSFAQKVRQMKQLFSKSRDGLSIEATFLENLNPYLVPGPNVTLLKRSKPLANTPSIAFGNMPNEGGHLLLTPLEKDELIRQDGRAANYIRDFIGAEEMMSGSVRYCLWLVDASPEQIKSIPAIQRRVDKVRDLRRNSRRITTQTLANAPTEFGEIRQPVTNYICFPRHSSETRNYIPIAYYPPSVIVHDSCCSVSDASLYHFGILTSRMHMAWTKRVAGRLESRYRYSNTLVYNNFPWPNDPTVAKREKIVELVQAVLDVRAKYPTCSLGTLYDGLLMPVSLTKAHILLDRAVDRLYRSEPFPDDQARVEHLFRLYEQLSAPLLPITIRRTRRRTI